MDELPRDPALHRAAVVWRAERRLDEQEWTRASVERFERSQSRLDVLRACLHRGDAVTVGWADDALIGMLVALGRDYALLADARGTVAIRVGSGTPAWLRVATRAREGGSRGTPAPATLRAWLLAHEGTVAEAAIAPAVTVAGRLSVGADHVRLRDDGGADTWVALSVLRWVRPRSRH